MLCDAKTTSIAERIHRPPLGGEIVPVAKAAEGGRTNGFFECMNSYEFIFDEFIASSIFFRMTRRKFAEICRITDTQTGRKLGC